VALRNSSTVSSQVEGEGADWVGDGDNIFRIIGGSERDNVVVVILRLEEGHLGVSFLLEADKH
jgi:hypothetical protein